MSKITLRNHLPTEDTTRVNYSSYFDPYSKKHDSRSRKKSIRIFICYAHDDFSNDAAKLRDYLAKVIPNSYVYFDYDKLKGEKWRRRNYDEIKYSDIVILVVTPATLYSKEIKTEIKLSKKYKKIIIPCLDDNLTIEWEDLPFNIGEIDGIQFDNVEILERKLYKEIMKITRAY